MFTINAGKQYDVSSFSKPDSSTLLFAACWTPKSHRASFVPLSFLCISDV